MKKVFIIHGFEGSPNGGWRPWLMAELNKLDIYACALAMPDSANPSPDQWVEEIDRHISESDDVYLIGHSLGVPAILLFLEKAKTTISGVILVSGPINKVNNEKVDGFLNKGFNFERITNSCKKFSVIHGDDDPLVPLSDGEQLSQRLNCNLQVVAGGQHLNSSAGFYELPVCLEELIKMGITK